MISRWSASLIPDCDTISCFCNLIFLLCLS